MTEIAGGRVDLVVGSGGDDTIELVEQKRPHVVVVTATLNAGDTTSLVDTIRGMLPRTQVAVVVIGDDEGGPIRNALDALELAPDRFVTRPIAPKALRFAVASGIEAVTLVRGPQPAAKGTSPGVVIEARKPAEDVASQRAALRARWNTLADSISDENDDEIVDGDILEEAATAAEPEPLPPPIIIKPRKKTAPTMDAVAEPDAWKPGSTEPPVEAPTREPTLILREPEVAAPPPLPPEPRSSDVTIERVVVAESRTSTGEDWGEPLPLAELIDRDTKDRDLDKPVPARTRSDELPIDDFDDDLVIDGERHRPSDPRLEVLADLPATTPTPDEPRDTVDSGRDFARQLRAKMSQMAQRLFQGADASAAPLPSDLAPRHDHSTEIDLSALGEDLPLGGGHTEIVESRIRSTAADQTTSPGSWDTQVRERGLPDSGELVRGVSDPAMLLAKMFAGGVTGRVLFRRDDVEKIVFFDQGRPVFASSSEARDRMGGLLVREGKITASQYERCQAVVAESGRRMGEILVDFGYLKRRELLPAVRRHVEDIVYSLFGWERGHYQITTDPQPSAERIRLSRHPAALVLEGIRRKYDRTTLERLLGPPSTVIEVADRERLGGIINLGDLAQEERSALAAFDGQSDLATVARVGGVDLADVLPLAWGLVTLGLAAARRTDTEVPDESTALVGESDVAIDRERVRARWQLVTEADYFALLGVRRDATAFEIRRAYQAARRDFAADGFPTDLRRELAQELDDIANVLDEAFRVLRDDRLRVTYLSNLIE
jgi:hypothetical protein